MPFAKKAENYVHFYKGVRKREKIGMKFARTRTWVGDTGNR